MNQSPLPDPSLWTVDWVGGCLEQSSEFCPHFESQERPIFDLASLTKVVVATTLVSELFIESKKSLMDFFKTPVVGLIPELENTELKKITLGELWEHRSGLQAHRLLFADSRKKIFDAYSRSKMWLHFLNELKSEKLNLPIKTIYTDLGFILLGLFVERARGGIVLDKQFEDWKKLYHLDLSAPTLKYGVSTAHLHRAPPTESRHNPGFVNDDNCYAMGGVSSHAGLFGTTHDLWEFLKVLKKRFDGLSPLAKQAFLPRAGIERFHAGWDTPSPDLASASQAGSGAPQGSIGHLGFTGTALWWNPSTSQAGILLSNRVRPQDSMDSRALIRKLRQEFFKEVWHNNPLGGELWKAVLYQSLTI